MPAEAVTVSVHIAAEPDVVFDYFTRPEMIVRWIGQDAVLDPKPGGEFAVDIDSVRVRGKYLVVERPLRLVISWGHVGSEQLPPGTSRLEIRFERDDSGTTVTIVHDALPQAEVDGHRQGWLHYLPRLPAAVDSAV